MNKTIEYVFISMLNEQFDQLFDSHVRRHLCFALSVRVSNFCEFRFEDMSVALRLLARAPIKLCGMVSCSFQLILSNLEQKACLRLNVLFFGLNLEN